MLVRDWMTADPITAAPTDSVLRIKQVMACKGFRRVPVVDNGRLVGIVSDADIREFTPSKASSLDVWEMHFIIDKLEIREVMTSKVITVEPAATMEEAAALMCRCKVHGLPVMDGHRLVGIVTESDLFKAFVDMMGGLHAGLRLEVEAGAAFGLSKMVATLEKIEATIHAIIYGPAPHKGSKRTMVIRVSGADKAKARAAIESAGGKVTDMRSIG